MTQSVYSALPMGTATPEDILNVMTEAMRVFEEMIWPANEPVPDKSAVIAFIESIRFELFKRCEVKNEIEGRSAVVIRQTPEQIRQAEVDAARNRDTWRERTRMGRDFAKQGAT